MILYKIEPHRVFLLNIPSMVGESWRLKERPVRFAFGTTSMTTKKKYIPYWEKLLDPRWQKKRLEILNRENFTCQTCGDASSTLHVHHGYYEKGLDPWEYDSDTLRCLCESCHESEQRFMRNTHKTIAKLRNDYKAVTLGVVSMMRVIEQHGISKIPAELDLEGVLGWIVDSFQKLKKEKDAKNVKK